MKKCLRFLSLLLCMVCLSGCASAPRQEAAESPATAEISEPENTPKPTPIPTPKPEPTPEPTPTPEPFPEKGEFFKRFDCEETGDWFDYLLTVPEAAEEGMPLIVFLHGDGQVAAPKDLLYSGILRAAKEIYGEDIPFILLQPCTRIPSWTDGSIPETLKALIDSIAEEYRVDTEKIIISGHSRGAIGTWNMVDKYPAYFSAAVPVSCPSMGFDAINFLDTPVRAFVGDNYNDYDFYGEAMVNQIYLLLYYGVDADITIIEDCDHASSWYKAFTPELFAWMLEQ